MFTEFVLDPLWVAARAKKMTANLAKNKGVGVDFVEFACGIIAARIKKDPLMYVQYGMYWWGIKNTLRANGYDYGDENFPLLEATYSFKDHAEMIAAAESFRDDYMTDCIQGTRAWVLDAENPQDVYNLFDINMETRV